MPKKNIREFLLDDFPCMIWWSEDILNRSLQVNSSEANECLPIYNTTTSRMYEAEKVVSDWSSSTNWNQSIRTYSTTARKQPIGAENRIQEVQWLVPHCCPLGMWYFVCEYFHKMAYVILSVLVIMSVASCPVWFNLLQNTYKCRVPWRLLRSGTFSVVY